MSAIQEPGGNGGKRVSILGTRGYPSYYGGFETAVRKIAPFLADHGWEVTVFGRDGSTKDDDPHRDPRVHSVKTAGVDSKSISTLSYGLTASVQTLRDKPDVVLIMNVANGYFLPLLKLRGISTVVNVDGIEWDRAKWGRVAKAVFRYGAKFTARFADMLIFDSREIERRWAQEFRRDGVFIPYGGDLPPDLPTQDGLVHRQYVLVVARFVPENTIPEFILAARRLSKDFTVVIVGSSGYGGELDEQVAALAESNPNVRWYGHVSDDAKLLSLWQHAGVYFHGHSVGGTNPTLVQAMAAGTPVVARNTVYNREVLGGAGAFAEPTEDSIVSAVDALMRDGVEQDRLSRAVLKRSREVYTWELVCEAYEKSLARAAGFEEQPSRKTLVG